MPLILATAHMPHELIVGMDFWRAFKLVPNVHNLTCSFDDGVGDEGDSVKVFDEATIEAFEAEISEMVVSVGIFDDSQKSALKALIEGHRPTLGRPELGCTDRLEHEIETGDATPAWKRYYSYSPKLREVLSSGLDEWLRLGVVEPSSSPWASPVLLVPKQDKTYRWVVDPREVNKVSKGDFYPLPKVSGIFLTTRPAARG